MAKQITSLHPNLFGEFSTSEAVADSSLADSSSEDQTQTSKFSLSNHFLIAMPALEDSVFASTVIYLCKHNARGAMGVIINQATEMTLAELFDRIDLKLENIPGSHPQGKTPVLFGGPVHDDRGFILHAPAGKFTSSLKITSEIFFTSSRDILEAVAAGDGPQQMLLTVGYAGWSEGQLEQEILSNCWLTVPADKTVLFDTPLEQRYQAAFRLLGIEPYMLSSNAGHA